MWRTFIQTSALILTLEASYFLLRSNLALETEKIFRLASPGFGFTPAVAEALAVQSADTTIGLGLLLLGFALQMANLLWPMRYKDFGVDRKGVILSVAGGVLVFIVSLCVASSMAKRQIDRVDEFARQQFDKS